MFNPERLTLARKRRRLSLRALAELSGLSPETIQRHEKGKTVPTEDTVSRLAQSLSFPQGFFFSCDPPTIHTDAISFRSFSKMSAKERDAAEAAGALGVELSMWVEEKFTLPEIDLLDLSYEENVEAAANNLREHWSLGQYPIGNLIGLLESKGVRILSLSENTASVNAFSFWRDDKPYIFLNNFKTPESSVFDTAHELAHLVLHRHGGPKERNLEREANAFASAFLMPEDDVRARIPHFVTVDLIIKAKARWRVSAMAMAYRLHKLGHLSDWQYKSLCIELGKRGYRTGEPEGIERETSLVWKKVLSYLWAEKITKEDIAKCLSLPIDELEGLIMNLAAVRQRPEPGQSLKRNFKVV